ncbi:MAG TPA: glycerate kinase, partial [Myxococcaceae bacterium]|nr:glycerate kinase [Myxococcaceae bacterium]
MRVLIAPQEFKGTLTGREAAEAIARGICSARPDWELDVAPLADGGPGTMEALLAACGGERRSAQVEDPLGRPVDAAFAILADRERTAVVEMAQASGLWRLARHELDAERASTFGTGQLVRAALEAGCRSILVGAGGSATNDGGAGAVEALGARLLDDSGHPLPRGGAALTRLARLEIGGLHPALREADLRVATDVRNPLLGPSGATYVFGPQKGADGHALELLEAALARFARVVAETTGRDLTAQEGAGAAGGLAFGLVALAGARIAGGFEEVSRALDLPRRLAWADAAITGEGRLDDQTRFGKGPGA